MFLINFWVLIAFKKKPSIFGDTVKTVTKEIQQSNQILTNTEYEFGTLILTKNYTPRFVTLLQMGLEVKLPLKCFESYEL